MKKLGLAVLLLVAGVFASRAQAQVGVYGEVSDTTFTNMVQSKHPVGFTTGVLIEGKNVLHDHVELAGDLQGRFINAGGYNYNGVAIGARAYVPMKWHLRPYAEFAFGFARLNNAADGPKTTDAQLQIDGGIAKKISPHMDVVGDFSYSQFYAFGGEYNPKTASLGVVYYFAKR